jgi:hypothetical protein
MIKRTDVANSWVMYDNTRQTTNPKDLRVLADSSDAEFDGNEYITFTDTGFEIQYSGDLTNASGGTYIYMAFADTRDLAFWRDQSGNGNDWQPNNLNYQDTVFDSPTNNYATLNPNNVSSSGVSLTNGNLNISIAAAATCAVSTMSVTSGKWYWEFTAGTASDNAYYVSICDVNNWSAPSQTQTDMYNSTYVWTYYGNSGVKITNATQTAYGSSFTSGDVIGVALDMDAGTLVFYKNNTSQGTAFSVFAGKTIAPMIGNGASISSIAGSINFGQSGFTYTPPAGFLALSTANLPEPSISPLYGASPQDHFNTVLYTGNGGTQSCYWCWVSNLILHWIKERSEVDNHWLERSIRGAGQFVLKPDKR